MRWIGIFSLCCFKSIATISWNWLATGKATVGLGGGFLKIHKFRNFWHKFDLFIWSAHNSPALRISLRSFSNAAWVNFRCNFTAFNVICSCPILAILSIKYFDFVIGRTESIRGFREWNYFTKYFQLIIFKTIFMLLFLMAALDRSKGISASGISVNMCRDGFPI